jgi:hypothetical protein
MSNELQSFSFWYSKMLSEKTKGKCEKVFVSVAIISFLLHLIVIGLIDLDIIHINGASQLLKNPISAIYTPFSFILIYEAYLLVYYLPKSTTIYIGKQYEIMTLIVIRRIFKDLTKLDFSANWYLQQINLNFIVDLIATLLLFYLIYVFYKLNKVSEKNKLIINQEVEVAKFINLKKYIALFLIPILLVLSFYSLGHWIYDSFFSITELVKHIKDVNKIFFDEFFTILILVDVLLLLFSFFLYDEFYKVIRNSGFIISTIILKISFATEGVLNSFLILLGVVFGILILFVHNKFIKLNQ